MSFDKHKQIEEELKGLKAYQAIFETIPLATLIIEEDTTISLVNKEFEELSGYSRKEIEGKKSWTEFVVKEDRERIKEYHHLRRKDPAAAPRNYESRFLDKEGNIEHVFATVDMIPGTKKSVISFFDITKRKQTHQKIRRMYTLETIISNINQVLIRTKNELELFQQICDLIVSIGYVKFAWIGFVEKETFDVKPAAFAGFEDGYLSRIKVRWDDSEYGRGATGTCIKTGKPVLIRDVETHPSQLPWRKESLKRGFASLIALPLIHKGETIGNLNVYSGEKNAFQKEEVDFLTDVATDITIGIKSLRLETDLERSLKTLRENFFQTVEVVSRLCELRDPYTSGHQKRVAELSCAIAKEMGFSRDQIEGIYVTALLHDIGKIIVPSEILSKPGKLTKVEIDMIQVHPNKAYDILKGLSFPWPVSEIILQHHERLDGSGYPQGLKGDEILLETHILGVADVVEAMSSHRPYRPALGLDKALEYILQNKGKLYAPEVVDVCMKVFTVKGFKFSSESLND